MNYSWLLHKFWLCGWMRDLCKCRAYGPLLLIYSVSGSVRVSVGQKQEEALRLLFSSSGITDNETGICGAFLCGSDVAQA